MQLDKETVHYLAQLSKIECTEEEERALLKDLSKILSYFDQLNEIDTEGTPPCLTVLENIQNVFREDEVVEKPIPLIHENAPSKTGGFFRVPEVIKKKKG